MRITTTRMLKILTQNISYEHPVQMMMSEAVSKIVRNMVKIILSLNANSAVK